MRRSIVVVRTVVAACARSGESTADAMERSGPHCEKRSRARDSDAFRACVVNEDINAAAANQRECDSKLLRRPGCVDPRRACDTPSP
jgi:hypothetical protein